MLFEPFAARSLNLKNRIVMAPMTRSRAVDANTPNALMAEYYGQRASAGLIVTEGTSPSPNGLGYARIPGLFNAAHVQGWKLSTSAVHARGRQDLRAADAHRTGDAHREPSGGCRGRGSWQRSVSRARCTPMRKGMQPHSVPRAMNAADIAPCGRRIRAVRAPRDRGRLRRRGAARRQWLSDRAVPESARQPAHATPTAGPSRDATGFAIEVAAATAAAIGPERVGIRLSPYGVFNGTGRVSGARGAVPRARTRALDPALCCTCIWSITRRWARRRCRPDFKLRLRAAFDGLFILSGGFDRATAEAALVEKRGDLVAFGRPLLANPDLVARLQAGAALNAPDMATFYTPGRRDTPIIRRSLPDIRAKFRRLTRPAYVQVSGCLPLALVDGSVAQASGNLHSLGYCVPCIGARNAAHGPGRHYTPLPASPAEGYQSGQTDLTKYVGLLRL